MAISNAQLVARFLKGSWRAHRPPLDLTPSEVARAAPLLIGSGAAALGWQRIKDTPALGGCPEADVLCHSGRLIALQDVRNDRAVEHVAMLLNQDGIEPLIFKGWAVAPFYASRYLRAYGDIDLCAPRGQFAATREILLRHSPPHLRNGMNPIVIDCGPEAQICTVDLHEDLDTRYMPPLEELFSRSSCAKAGSADVRVLALEDHLRLVVMHFLKHGGWRPSGLCDVAAMVEATPAGFDWRLCLSEGNVVAGWMRATIGLAHRLLDLSLDAVPPEAWIDPPWWFERAVLHGWEAPYAGRFTSIAVSGLSRYPSHLLRVLRTRWPTPIAALIARQLPVDTEWRLPVQVGCFASVVGKGLQKYSMRPLRADHEGASETVVVAAEHGHDSLSARATP